jgi:Tfp pilus assembly protein PilN
MMTKLQVRPRRRDKMQGRTVKEEMARRQIEIVRLKARNKTQKSREPRLKMVLNRRARE